MSIPADLINNFHDKTRERQEEILQAAYDEIKRLTKFPPPEQSTRKPKTAVGEFVKRARDHYEGGYCITQFYHEALDVIEEQDFVVSGFRAMSEAQAYELNEVHGELKAKDKTIEKQSEEIKHLTNRLNKVE